MLRTVRETRSTNDELLEAARRGEVLREGEWLIADRQTAGRGRQGRSWFDGAGNYMGSTAVVLRDTDPAPATLSFVSALAVHASIEPFLPADVELRLKWPNDILLNGAKVNGVLLERTGATVIVGIGVNLAVAPDVPGKRTTAIALHAPPPGRDLFAQTLAGAFADELERWRHHGLPTLMKRWQAVAHPVGTPLSVAIPGEPEVAGTFAGLNPDGALRLRLRDGALRAIHAGDVLLAEEG